MKTPEQFLQDGLDRMLKWCGANNVIAPNVKVHWEGAPPFSVCAYYRDNLIYIWPKACARVTDHPRSWSYPGYTVDRTPFGVIQHELAHHVEHAHGSRGGLVAAGWMSKTAEPAITGYAPTPNEWFAEMFRVYVTNPNLLMYLRPDTYALMINRWPHLVETRPWNEVLAGSPRHFVAAQNKILDAELKKQRRLML